jgi:hypothetical protein
MTDTQNQSNIPAYNFDTESSLSWKQRLQEVEPQLKQFFLDELRRLYAAEGQQLIISSEGNEPKLIFSNGQVSSLINAVTTEWSIQGCPLLNLQKYVGMVMNEVCTEFLAEISQAVEA